MKIYECIKSEDERIIRLFGFTIVKQTSDYMTTARYQDFLGGTIKTVKINQYEKDSFIKDISIFGKTLIQRTEANNYKTYSLFGKPFFKISLIDQFKKSYFSHFAPNHDHIYILRANAGETYLTLTYLLNSLIKKNNSKNPLLVATKKYHIDMIKMICPEIPYTYIKKMKFKIVGDDFEIDNFKFFFLFSNAHFRQVEDDIKKHALGQSHYFDSILNRLGLKSDDIKMRKIADISGYEQSMLEKIGKTGLNLDKFVFIAPEAQSCKLYDEEFWVALINKLQQIGYDIYVNLTNDAIKLKGATGFKLCDLNFGESFALAKRAQKIVSLRSGFTEFLLQTNTPIDVLYTKFRNRHIFNDMDTYHVMSGFGLSTIPYVDMSKIQEFNMFETSSIDCLNKIINTL